MKKIYKSALTVAAAAMGATMIAGNASASTATSDAVVTVQNQALTLVNDAPLNFGTILPYGRPGTVTINASGTHSASWVYVSVPGAPSIWSVTGVNSAPYAVTLPAANSVSLTNTGGAGETMTIGSFHRSGGTHLALDAAGVDSFNVGATLNVGSNQPAGIYTGTFDVTVSYN